MPTIAQLTQQVSDLLIAWNEREAQFRDWLGGTATGGPNRDGRYPLTDASGRTKLVDCPAKLADTVAGPAGASEGARVLAEAARAAAEQARDRTEQIEDVLLPLRDQVVVLHSQAKQFRNDTAADAAAAVAARTTALSVLSECRAIRDQILGQQYSPALRFSDNRNSQYLPVVFF